MNSAEKKMKLPLFDDYWIDFRRDTVRRWFTPEHYSLAPAGPYSSLLYDPELGKYRFYYENVRKWACDGERDLYLAESEDMKHFTRVKVNGSEVIYDGVSGLHGLSVMIDP